MRRDKIGGFMKISSCIRTNLYRGAIFILPMRGSVELEMIMGFISPIGSEMKLSLADGECEERSMYVAR